MICVFVGVIMIMLCDGVRLTMTNVFAKLGITMEIEANRGL